MSLGTTISAPTVIVREGGGRRFLIPIYIGIHLLPLLAIWFGVTLADCLVGIGLMMLRGFCMSAGYHRLLAHHSYRTWRWVRFLLAFCACATLRGGPLWWVSWHRHHHRHSDQPIDIHPPGTGFWLAYVGWILSGRHATTDYRIVKDLARVPELRWLNRYWLLPSLMFAVATYLIGGWSMLAIGYGLSTVVLLHTLCLLDSLDHRWGTQRYATRDESRNNMILALLSLGEGWHNNHHEFPGSARHGLYWWESDTTYIVLWLASRVGLVWDLHTPTPSDLKRNRVQLSRPQNAAPVLATQPVESN